MRIGWCDRHFGERQRNQGPETWNTGTSQPGTLINIPKGRPPGRDENLLDIRELNASVSILLETTAPHAIPITDPKDVHASV